MSVLVSSVSVWVPMQSDDSASLLSEESKSLPKVGLLPRGLFGDFERTYFWTSRSFMTDESSSSVRWKWVLPNLLTDSW